MEDKTIGRFSDAELSLCSKSDESAFSELVMRYLGMVRGLAKHYAVGGCELDDMLSEGLAGLVSAVRSYDPDKGASFSTYCYACVNNGMINAIKRSNRIRGSEEPIDETCVPPQSFPEGGIEAKELYSDLEAKLSRRERAVLRCRICGLTNGEIAEKLGMEKKSVDNALFRVKRKLRAEEKQI